MERSGNAVGDVRLHTILTGALTDESNVTIMELGAVDVVGHCILVRVRWDYEEIVSALTTSLNKPPGLLKLRR